MAAFKEVLTVLYDHFSVGAADIGSNPGIYPAKHAHHIKARIHFQIEQDEREFLLAHQRWSIEQGHQQLEEELGLDYFEGRSWRGLYHHLTLCLMAHWFLTRLRVSKKQPTLPEVRRWLMEALNLSRCPLCQCLFTRHDVTIDSSQSLNEVVL